MSARLLLALFVFTSPAHADLLGWSLSHTNDSLADQYDRWRTAEVQGSLVFGAPWTGELPTSPFALTELRGRAEIVSPANISTPDPRDRAYVPLLSLGLHTHWQASGWDLTAGGDLIALGPQTGLEDIQTTIHRVLGFPKPNVDAVTVPNDVRFALSVEASRSIPLAPRAQLRPFVAAETGLETLIRVGGDLDLGAFQTSELRVRQSTSGHRLAAVRDPDAEGLRFTLGADAAWVNDSALLPNRSPMSPRIRVRLGAEQRGRAGAAFYGLTWLGEEFETQAGGQFVGTLSLRLEF